MSLSRSCRAVVYGRLPPVPTGGLPVFGLIADAKSPLCTIPAAELSSQYCSHRSASRISAAARNRRMDASPRDSFPPESSSAALGLLANKALAGSNIALVAPRPLRKDRLPTIGRIIGSEVALLLQGDCV